MHVLHGARDNESFLLPPPCANHQQSEVGQRPALKDGRNLYDHVVQKPGSSHHQDFARRWSAPILEERQRASAAAPTGSCAPLTVQRRQRTVHVPHEVNATFPSHLQRSPPRSFTRTRPRHPAAPLLCRPYAICHAIVLLARSPLHCMS